MSHDNTYRNLLSLTVYGIGAVDKNVAFEWVVLHLTRLRCIEYVN